MKKEVCYQNIDDEKYGSKDMLRKHSKFYNEGRWNNFIKPLLPKDCKGRSFVEVGCNAGMYLKLAEDMGFKRVTGIEKSKGYIKQAQYYKEKTNSNYKLIRRWIGQWDCDYKRLPVADVTLMSCVHYHMRPIELVEWLDHLKLSTLYCILVSVEDVKREKVNRVGGSMIELMRFFRDWEVVDTIDFEDDSDPAPRKMYSILFKSKLKRYKVKDLLEPPAPNPKLRASKYKDVFVKYIEAVLNNSSNLEETEFFKIYVQGRRPKVGAHRRRRAIKLIDMIKSVKEDGMLKPLLVERTGYSLDGSHRCILLEYLKHKYVIGREL